MRTKQGSTARCTAETTRLSLKTLMLFFIFAILIANMLSHNASAASIGLSVPTPRPGNRSITISWDSAPNVKYYAYSVRDTTTNESIRDRSQTSKLYAKISHTWEDGHTYRVWAGACCEGNDDIYRNMNVYNFINVNDVVPDIGVSESETISVRIGEEVGAIVGNGISSSKYNGGYSIAGTNLGTNVYLNSSDLTDWTKPEGLFGEHNMYATYLELVDGYMDGNLPSYELDTDIFYSEYFDHSYNDAYKKLANIADDAVRALKITRKASNPDSWAARLLDLVDAAK